MVEKQEELLLPRTGSATLALSLSLSLIDANPNRPISSNDVNSIPVDRDTARVSCDARDGRIYNPLCLSPTKAAATILHDVEAELGPRNGIEVWRRLRKHVHSGSDIRRHALRGQTWNPSHARSVADVNTCVGHWGTKIREYTAAGGQVTDEDKRLVLPKLLPKALAEDLLMKVSGFGSSQRPMEHVKTRCGPMTFFKGKIPGPQVEETDDLAST